MNITTSKDDQFNDLIEDAVNAYYHAALKELERKDLGILEERQLKIRLAKCKAFFDPSNYSGMGIKNIPAANEDDLKQLAGLFTKPDQYNSLNEQL